MKKRYVTVTRLIYLIINILSVTYRLQFVTFCNICYSTILLIIKIIEKMICFITYEIKKTSVTSYVTATNRTNIEI